MNPTKTFEAKTVQGRASAAESSYAASSVASLLPISATSRALHLTVESTVHVVNNADAKTDACLRARALA